ncbi:MAG: UDP-N-acetylglucosamine 1-carboxyvinyltransferase [Clostridia bacterium]|nr:UDP-N-acetylglucosamine 1-carboxyvinyltransferase [Clostridia bacterium]
MDEYRIEGGHRLQGSVRVQGAKNSALPILAACAVCRGISVIHNCPQLSDIDATINILRHLGCKVTVEGHTVTVDSTQINTGHVPDTLMQEMRSSVIFLGAIAARMGKASVSLPGGCEIGLRPIDLHLDALRKLGAVVTEEGGHIYLDCPEGMKGSVISLSFPSVGATENVLIAACTAKGTTTLVNAAREPEISDLADFLNRCGARITGAGEGIITIEGVSALHGAQHHVIPDRIVAASYMLAAAVTHGNVTLQNIIPAHLGPVTALLQEAGCDIRVHEKQLNISAPSQLKAMPTVRTMPYPGFPTDVQAPMMAACCIADGTTIVIETIFESRFRHVPELCRFGADILVDGRIAVVKGVNVLHAATVSAPDLRGGVALVLAGLAAQGQTTVRELQHIDRGYESLADELSRLGADIRRVKNEDGSKQENGNADLKE